LRYPQDLRDFFLNLYDGLRLFQFIRELFVITFKPGNFLGKGINLSGLPPSFLGRKAVQHAFIALPEPCVDIGMIKTFSAKKCPDFS
jgi:hypothetical protein